MKGQEYQMVEKSEVKRVILPSGDDSNNDKVKEIIQEKYYVYTNYGEEFFFEFDKDSFNKYFSIVSLRKNKMNALNKKLNKKDDISE